MIKLEHQFAKICNCKKALLKDVTTLRKFMYNIEKCAEKEAIFYKDKDSFKGDAFECFVEFFNKLKEGQYVYNYKLLDQADRDTGVDALGTGKNGKPAAIQIKYRSNTEQLLTANDDHLSNFVMSAAYKYGVDVNDNKNLIIFTTAKDLHYFTKNEMFLNKVTCIGYDELSAIVDNDIMFWKEFEEALNGIKNLSKKSLKTHKLYQHQKDALKAVNNATNGIVHLPTGTGKTTIIARSIIEKIVEENKKGNVIEPIIIMSPRIILTHQILNDIRSELIKHKINCKYINVNSGLPEDNEDLRNLEDLLQFNHFILESTTNADQIINAYNNAKAANCPLVILAVYNSVKQIQKAGIPVSNIYCDEAHYLLSNEFNYITDKDVFVGANKYYFTATLKETKSDDSVGMNNKDKYGEIIFAKSPIDMINDGIIVRPRVHIISSKDSFYVSTSATNKQKDAIDPHAIIKAYEEHKTLCNTGAKLLIICKGTEHLEGIINSKYFINYCKSHPTLSIYSVTSQFGAKVTRDINQDGVLDNSEINKKITRREMLKQIKGLKDSEDAIIFHIDILTEGIDVPGITGILPLTPLGTSKMLQNLGRATRLHKTDRDLLLKHKLSTNFTKLNKYGEAEEALKYIKPYSYIILPNYTEENIEQRENWKELLSNIRSYGFKPSEDVVMVDNRGSKKPQSMTLLNQEQKDVKGIKTKVIDLINEIEEEEKANEFFKEKINCNSLDELNQLYS